jgi:spermidine synthase
MNHRQHSVILVLILFFASGITGLVYQVAWTRLFVTVFGSTTHAVSTVLAAFMGGLALGSLILGRLGDRLKRPVLTYGVLEILIGIYALLVPLIIHHLVGLYSGVFSAFGQRTLPVTLLRFLVSFLIILIPTTLMGGTLPVLSRFAGAEVRRLGRGIGTLYAVNTFGAVLGSFLSGFILLEAFGVSTSVYMAAAISLLVGLAAVWIGRRAPSGETPKERAPKERAPKERAPKERAPERIRELPGYTGFLVLLVICISGTAALAYEVVYTKILVFSLGSSAHAFSLMLTTFLAGLALGSFISSRLADRLKRPAEAFGVVEILIGVAALASVFLLARLDVSREYLGIRDAGGNVLALRAAGFLQAASIMLVPSILMGMAFPLAARLYARTRVISSSVGRIYFFNTLGAVAGSLLAGFVLVPLIGSARSIAFMAAFNVGAGLLLFTSTRNRRAWSAAAVGITVALVILALNLSPSIFAETFNIKEPGSRLLYFKEGVSGTVTVHRYRDYDLLAIDGVNVAGTSDMLRVTQKLQGHLPVLLAGGKERVAHIGFGSGETLRILTVHDVDTIDGIEICRDVITAARRYFSAINRNVFDRPNVNIIIMDGKNYVLLTDREYDIIMTDSIYPGTGGASALYTYDHFKAVRDKLKPGGIASCWLPMDLSPTDLRIALKAFYDVFPNMSVWYCYMTFSQHALVVGRKDVPVEIDMARLIEAYEDPVIKEDLASILIPDPYTLASCLLADGEAVREFCGDAPRHSDDHPVLEFGLARRGSAKPYLSSNLEQLLALRPNPVDYLSGLEKARPEPEAIRRRVAERTLVSDHIIAGHLQLALGEAGKARRQYQEVIELEPDNPIARRSIEELDRTLQGMKSVAAAGSDYRAVYRLGVRYLGEGRLQEALGQLKQALEQRPDLPDPYVSIGECYLRWGEPDSALKYLEEANRISPEHPGILLRLGICLERVGRTADAMREYEKALDLDPDSYEVLNNLGNLYLAEGRLDEARVRFQRAVEAAPARPHALYNLGLTYARERAWTTAARYFRETIDKAPGFHPAHYSLGNALHEMGDTEGALEAWKRTLALKPDHREARRKISIHGER